MEVFTKIIAIMNCIMVVYLFKATYYDIFEHLLAASFKDGKLFDFVSTYFGIIKRKNGGIFYLYYLV